MSRGKILIVDDEPDIAEALGDRLEVWGFEVRVVQGARGPATRLWRRTRRA